MPSADEGTFKRLVASINPAWIEQALAATGTATLRTRRLPAEQVIWLVLGMALYRHRPIDDLVHRLDLVLPGVDDEVSVAKSAVAQARARLGDEPLRWLFEKCSTKWATESAQRHAWRGLALYGVDGTTVRVADSTAKELKVSSQARAVDPSLPETFQARAITYQRPGFAPQLLLTSMLDRKASPAKEIVALYHERWELELGFGEVKTDMLDRQEAIRSKTPKGVAQELWAVGLAYNLVRLEMERVAEEAEVPPNRISFVMALRLIRDEWMWSSATNSPGAIPGHLRRLREDVARFILPERRQRTQPRAVKLKMSGYPRKRPTVAPRRRAK
jgi:hypothetical protein